MPVRMVDDEQDNYSNENENISGSGGNFNNRGGGLLQFLPMIIGLLIRKPALLLVVIIIGGIMFFRGSCSKLSNITNESAAQYSRGGKLDPEEYKKADVYEGLDPSKNDLPEIVSLKKICTRKKKSRSARQLCSLE